MNECSYCGKPLKRNLFCNSSHKVMFHRDGGKVKKDVTEEKKDVIENSGKDFCKHGSQKGLCKHGCV